MNLRRVLLLGAIALGLVASGMLEAGVGAVPTAEASGNRTASAKAKAKAKAKTTTRDGKSKRTAAATSRKRNKKTAKVKLCNDVTVGKGKKARNKKKCSFVKEFQGHGVQLATLETAELGRPSGNLWLRSDNLREAVKVQIYKEDGSYDESALAQLDNIFRCKRTQEVRSMDPRLYDQLSRIQDHFEGKQIEIVSGFRFAERNSSRHFHASAMDIKVEGESIRSMYAYAQSLDRGNMGIGIYPHAGFIHVDFRAPGEPSYRWTDYSGAGSGQKAKKGKRPGRSRPKRPTS